MALSSIGRNVPIGRGNNLIWSNQTIGKWRKIMLKGFRDFIARGNMVEMAVAFVMGSAVTAIVTSLVDSVINPLIAAIFSMPDMDKVWNVTVNGSVVKFGAFVGAIINFLIIAFAIFMLLKAVNRFNKKKAETPAPDEPPADVQLLTEIRDLLKK